ncbi:MAG: efflux RND transporter periplasmic adaptor subunit [Nostoc sp. DedQUE05]|uniref:efflux RND transporter periplasmic adaptor subunit n=1 Tax=Nostoc sp. DedQUE05 TaxID=3075391 RepID=UPI002AD3193C|nr:efflux RND transporter periplasmic adaptor subunit [Nostoc sp. DedQUE05]MDZ8090952.1 efflux RND transporter periplasmic adaptor subunit [Nostoc sp. DedQUE05]
MGISNLFQSSTPLRYVSLTMLMLLLSTPTTVLAGGGHDHSGSSSFQAGGESTSSVEVDAETAKLLGVKVEPVQRQRLAVGIKTTGQIETLPSQQVEVTTPIQGVKVVELLVEPGALVKKGQPVAILTSPDLVELRVNSQEKLAQGQADLQQAEADLRLAQQNRDRYQQIADAEIAQAQSQVAFAQEKYEKDRVLATEGALARRNALESQTQLAEAKAKLTTANSRRDVIASENQLKRAQAAVSLAKSNISRSSAIYETRLLQLGNSANAKGLITVTAPISGKIVDREVTIGQSFEDAGGKLMTIVDDSRVFATANIYEKDLGKVRTGQPLRMKVASVPNQTFTGRITRIGSVVAGETRVVPVQTEINNARGQLKPGMFAELEVLTDQKSLATLVIPASAVVDANNKKLVYVQNGNAFQSVEVELGQISGDLIEIKSGLFEGDSVVTQRAPQLYAQSLKGGSKEENHEEGDSHSEEIDAQTNSFPLPLWLLGAGGGLGIAIVAFMGGSFWSSRRIRSGLVPVNDGFNYETEVYIDNHKQPTASMSAEEYEKSHRSDSH